MIFLIYPKEKHFMLKLRLILIKVIVAEDYNDDLYLFV